MLRAFAESQAMGFNDGIHDLQCPPRIGVLHQNSVGLLSAPSACLSGKAHADPLYCPGIAPAEKNQNANEAGGTHRQPTPGLSGAGPMALGMQTERATGIHSKPMISATEIPKAVHQVHRMYLRFR
jgi:hypothetical protein